MDSEKNMGHQYFLFLTFYFLYLHIMENDIQNFGHQLKSFFAKKFNLDDDKEEQNHVVENITKGVEFKGVNLWILMFAVVIASVGLNVNSTAVIIGAMLVSPLMGPIMGIGLSLGINDFELLKKSFKNFLFAVGVSLAVSTLYFTISPALTTQSELLARTTPTIWDVLIATFGGLAGIVAQTRKDRTSTVIPGVAIATALMPPLCTAGFGLATGQWAYFGGAFYLFTINAVFIALATFFIVRAMKYEHKQLLDPKRAKRVQQLMIFIITATLVPSVILAYSIVQQAVFENNAKNYVAKVFTISGSQVLSTNITYHSSGNTIEVMLVGNEVNGDVIQMAQNQLESYKLKNTKLVVRQASTSDHLDNSQMQNILLTNTEIISEKKAKIDALETRLSQLQTQVVPSAEIARELAALWDNLKTFSMGKAYTVNAQGKNIDSVLLCVITADKLKPLSDDDNIRLTKWLIERTKTDNVKLMIE